MNKGQRITKKTLYFTVFAFVMNFVYGMGNAVLGIATDSWWLITLSAYYIILSIMRFSVVFYEKKGEGVRAENEKFIKRFSGYMFFVLAIVLCITTYLTVKEHIGTQYHEIAMITVALYTFIKVTLAVVKLCQSRKEQSPVLTTVRNISLADALASVYSLQRSMLVSFGSLPLKNINLFNGLTGTGVCATVVVLGVGLIRKDNENWQNPNW